MSVKAIAVTAVVFLLLRSSHEAAAQKPSPKQWKAAVYHGLVMGTSTRQDALKVLGKADWVGHESDTGKPMMEFTVADPVPGKLSVYLTSKGIVSGAALYPKKEMTERDAIHLLGTNYTIGRYSTDDCLAEGGTSPIYETPNGYDRRIEYRGQGLSVKFDNENVEAIIYGNGSPVPTESRCKNRSPEQFATP